MSVVLSVTFNYIMAQFTAFGTLQTYKTQSARHIKKYDAELGKTTQTD